MRYGTTVSPGTKLAAPTPAGPVLALGSRGGGVLSRGGLSRGGRRGGGGLGRGGGLSRSGRRKIGVYHRLHSRQMNDRRLNKLLVDGAAWIDEILRGVQDVTIEVQIFPAQA